MPVNQIWKEITHLEVCLKRRAHLNMMVKNIKSMYLRKQLYSNRSIQVERFNYASQMVESVMSEEKEDKHVYKQTIINLMEH
mgnify:CR=1 FL=1